ncbi:MAG: hypothetical protein D6800_01510 [Candidatus Zixiibacteriota bacterium]|nr:MAG: hypothetical protein D6800_01510 [candidate division Zixibacteria bacterium]
MGCYFFGLERRPEALAIEIPQRGANRLKLDMGSTNIPRTAAVPLIFVFLFAASCSCGKTREESRRPEYGRLGVLAPYLIGRDEYKMRAALEQSLDAEVAGKPALSIAAEGLAHLYYGSRDQSEIQIQRGLDLLEFLFDGFPHHRKDDAGHVYWLYPEPYNTLPANWWSAMDNAAVGLLAHQAYLLTRNADYLDRAHRALETMLLPPQSGGSLLELPDGGCWLSEYTWPEVTPDSELYVLNGALYALQALLMVSPDLEGEPFRTQITCIQETLQSVAGRFHYPDGRWTFYSLNPRPKANPSHYMLFEIAQFDALFKLTRDSFYNQEAAFRRNAMVSQYRPVWRPETQELFFSRIGGPEPYLLDIYDPELICRQAEHLDWDHFELPVAGVDSFFSAAFYRMRYGEPEACTLRVYEEPSHSEITIAAFPQPVSPALWEEPHHLITRISRILFDAVPGTKGTIDVLPSRMARPDSPDHYYNSQGRVYLQFENPVSAAAYAAFGILLDQMSPPHDLILAFDLIDSQGATSYRDYRRLCAHPRYLLLIPSVGGTGSRALTDISEISVIIRTSELEQQAVEKLTLNIDEVLAFRHWADVVPSAHQETDTLAYLNDPIDRCP